MSFLSPWFLLGAAAIAGPIIFHLIRRATRNRIQFSATQFLEASPPRLQKRSTLQHPWLLLLRCLIIALLAFGFSRPFFNREIPVLQENSQVHHTVLLLDESASMRRTGHWDAAKRQLIDWVSETGIDHRLSILAVSDSISHILSDELWEKTPKSERVSLLKGLLENREPGWGSTYLDTGVSAALDELEHLAENSDKDAVKTIRIFSDLTTGARLTGLAGRDWPTGCVLEFDPTLSSDHRNVGIQWLGWSKIGEGPKKARISLITSGDNQTVTLKAVDPKTGNTLGEAQTVFTQVDDRRLFLLEIPESHEGPFIIEVSGDKEPFDNRLFVAPENIRELSLPYIGSGSAADPKTSLFYLQRAVAGWEDPVVSVKPADGAWSQNPDTLLIILDTPSAGQNEEIKAFLNAGGSALFLFKEPQQTRLIETWTGENGWQSPRLSRDYALLGSIDFEHPVFKIFSDPRYNNFTNVRFWKAQPVEPPSNSGARVLAHFDEGPAAIVEVQVGSGKLLIWGGDWTPQASQWVLSTKFVPWLQQVVESALGGPALPTMAYVDNPSRISGDQPGQWLDEKSNLLTEAPQAPGLYQFSRDNRSHWVALNMHHEESRIDPLPFDTWEKLGVPLEPAQLVVSEEVAEAKAAAMNAIELEGEQKLWRWLLIGTALFLAFESLVSITLSRRGAAAAEA
ncbi:MAG: BatA domain-containing protein [Verrucomicrobiae bacterium]|nr:BatA domain-containing protein [Verrucomicrobiae bacterium]